MKESKVCWIIVGRTTGGGTQAVAQRTFNDYKKLGVNVRLIVIGDYSLDDKDESVKALEKANVSAAIRSLYLLWFKERPSVIISFNLEVSLVILPLRLLGTKIVTRVMNTMSKRVEDSRLNYKTRIISKFYVWFMPLFSQIIVQCECMKRDLLKMNGKINKSKLTTIYNPLPTSPYNISKNKAVEDITRVLVISRLEKHKNVSFIVDIANVLVSRNLDFEVSIYGSGPMKSSLSDRIDREGLKDFVILEGQVAFSEIEFHLFDVLVLPSKYEGFPNVLLESIANNVPVIAKDIKCGPEEIIIPNVNGLLLKSWSPESWADAIVKVKKNITLTNSELPEALSRKVRNKSLLDIVDV